MLKKKKLNRKLLKAKEMQLLIKMVSEVKCKVSRKMWSLFVPFFKVSKDEQINLKKEFCNLFYYLEFY